jgi:DNA-binding transcriptional ArsR family regulator
MSAEGLPSLDSKRIKALGNETRVRILDCLKSHGVASAPELTRELSIRENLANYHLGVLLDCDCIEIAVTRKRSGKDTRFFRVKPGVAFPTMSLSPLFKEEEVSRHALRAFGRKVSSVLEGTDEEGSGTTIAFETFSLTEPDQFVAQEALRLTVANLRRLAEQSRQVSIATDAPLTSIELGIAMIPASPPNSDTRDVE